MREHIIGFTALLIVMTLAIGFIMMVESVSTTQALKHVQSMMEDLTWP